MSEPRAARRQREALSAECEFLERSLADLDLEHRAGDVDDLDFATLREGYLDRLAATERSLAAELAGGATRRADPKLPAGRRLRRALGRPRTRRVLGGIGVACFLGVLVVVALVLAGVRLPGQSATGTISLPANESIDDELAAASVFGSQGELSQAITLYDAVLARAPHNPEALTNRAWLIRLVGVAGGSRAEVRSGDATLAQVARLAPGYAPARAFLGIADLEDRRQLQAAIGEFRALLRDKLPLRRSCRWSGPWPSAPTAPLTCPFRARSGPSPRSERAARAAAGAPWTAKVER